MVILKVPTYSILVAHTQDIAVQGRYIQFIVCKYRIMNGNDSLFLIILYYTTAIFNFDL